MKNFRQSKIFFLFLLLTVCTLTVEAQRKPAPREMQFDALKKYVEPFPEDRRFKRRVGARFIIPDAPPGKKFEPSYVKNLYRIVSAEEGFIFLISAEMAKSLRSHLKSDVAFWRVACTIVEFGDSDVGLYPYVTKVEGLDKNGMVVWTTIGREPRKLDFVE